MQRVLVAVLGSAALLGILGGTGSAATTAAPANVTPPSITGTATEGAALSGHRGSWSGNPTQFASWWRRCDSSGNNCANIPGTVDQGIYRVHPADDGHRLRFSVGATNHDGTTWKPSAPTAVVTAVAPVNESAPTVVGNAVVGQTVTGTRGTWSGNPTDFNTWWQRCGSGGSGCVNIPGTSGRAHYKVATADVGGTLRYAVGAANKQGRTWVSSAATAVVVAPVARPTGCPTTTSPDDVSAISSPARLILDGIQAPSVIVKQTTTLVLRFHVSSTCGGSVRGALVYVTATPFFQFSVPPEAATGADGWAEVHMRRLSGFPVSSRQQLLALFVRARKAGEDPLAGISTRRLFSVRVDLHA